MIYVLIETANVDLLSVQTYARYTEAYAAFEFCAELNHALVVPVENEIDGTLAIAGDDTYAVQLIEREITP